MEAIVHEVDAKHVTANFDVVLGVVDLRDLRVALADLVRLEDGACRFVVVLVVVVIVGIAALVLV